MLRAALAGSPAETVAPPGPNSRHGDARRVFGVTPQLLRWGCCGSTPTMAEILRHLEHESVLEAQTKPFSNGIAPFSAQNHACSPILNPWVGFRTSAFYEW
jgi:hypothetical protein